MFIVKCDSDKIGPDNSNINEKLKIYKFIDAYERTYLYCFVEKIHKQALNYMNIRIPTHHYLKTIDIIT